LTSTTAADRSSPAIRATARPSARWLGLILGGLLIGSLWGALFGFLIHRMGDGQHDFASLRSLAANRYDVTIADAYAERARELLSPLA
jgi:predicted lipid-binding transport protein (Tim44 family)